MRGLTMKGVNGSTTKGKNRETDNPRLVEGEGQPEAPPRVGKGQISSAKKRHD